MKSVFQEDEYGCGIACIAMLTGTTYQKAKEVCGNSYIPGDGIEEGPILELIKAQGLRIVRKGRITKKLPVTDLALHALLWCQQLPSKGTIVRARNVHARNVNVHDHWAVWDADAAVVRDPYRYKKPLWLTNFFEKEVIA